MYPVMFMSTVPSSSWSAVGTTRDGSDHSSMDDDDDVDSDDEEFRNDLEEVSCD